MHFRSHSFGKLTFVHSRFVCHCLYPKNLLHSEQRISICEIPSFRVRVFSDLFWWEQLACLARTSGGRRAIKRCEKITQSSNTSEKASNLEEFLFFLRTRRSYPGIPCLASSSCMS